ncbi:MAG: hypothetical protein FJ386_12790 [Verrucomicrobia bacterium]|nr:hypothetical protein [Verrucomicrobiota bacterium]
MKTSHHPPVITLILNCIVAAQIVAAERTPAQQYEAIAGEYDLAQAAFTAAVRAAKIGPDRDKVRATKRPDVAAFASRFLKLADAHPKDPAAVDALVWAANNGDDDHAHKALDRLFADHTRSQKIAAVCEPIASRITDSTEQRLRKLLGETPHRDVKAQAAFALGLYCKNKAEVRADLILNLAGAEKDLRPVDRKHYEDVIKSSDPVKLADEAVKWFQQVAAQHATEPALAKRAQAQVHEVSHFCIGREAMEIEGADVDGKKMKLSDFRGRVVVLDFWGDW